MKRLTLLILAATTSILFFYSCDVRNDGGSSSIQQRNQTQRVFSDTVTQFRVQVFYEPTAAPYTGTLNITRDTWDITKQSLTSLFQNHPARTIAAPTTTADMTTIPAQNITAWSQDQLINLGQAYASPLLNGSTITISVIFVKGFFNNDNSVLGVHITGQPFVFIFKDVVTSAGGTSNDQKYIEQAVVVHEIGHAVGLVNNSLPMQAPHEDAAHSKHSSNSQCVMYWQVESSTTILTSLANFILNGDLNLFGPESLNDARAFHP